MKGDDPTATALLKRTAPAWYWLRENFSLAAVLTIVGILGAAGGYIVTLRTRVVVLETEVIHITKIVPDSGVLATLKTKIDDHEERLSRLEDDWDYAGRKASELGPHRRQPQSR